MTPLETVQGIYQAFGRGDIPSILATVADDVAWEAWADNSAQKAGVRWMTPRRGKAGVLEFFQLVAQFQIHEFKVLSIRATGNKWPPNSSSRLHPPGASAIGTRKCTCGPSVPTEKSRACGTISTRRSTSRRRGSNSQSLGGCALADRTRFRSNEAGPPAALA
jgi:hypothetical protein